ncbi:hypothetical protein D3C84_1240410 [compost metagenome]
MPLTFTIALGVVSVELVSAIAGFGFTAGVLFTGFQLIMVSANVTITNPATPKILLLFISYYLALRHYILKK